METQTVYKIGNAILLAGAITTSVFLAKTFKDGYNLFNNLPSPPNIALEVENYKKEISRLEAAISDIKSPGRYTSGDYSYHSLRADEKTKIISYLDESKFSLLAKMATHERTPEYGIYQESLDKHVKENLEKVGKNLTLAFLSSLICITLPLPFYIFGDRKIIKESI